MNNELLKKFDKKKQLLVSPLALAISACGGGGTSEGDDGTSSSEASKNKSVDLTYSQKMDFSSLSEDLVVPANYEMNWLGKQKYGASEYFFAVMMSPNIIHISSQLDSDLVVLPSWYAYEPFLAAFSLQKDLDDVISLGAIDTSTKIGWARNWEEIVVNGNKAVVIADTGHELATGQNTWLKGDIWLANLSGNGEFEISAISGINAFYHDVDVGDINDDGLEDILAINMSYDDGADPYPLHVFFQQQDGTFNQQLGFMSFTDNLPMLGGASGAVVDLDNDGSLEIVQAAYTVRDFPNWDMANIFRVFGKDDDGEYSLQFSAPRSGKASQMGSSNVYEADLDLDGDLDLLFYMEGYDAISDISGTAENFKQGIQIWLNNGDLTLTEVTDDWLDMSVWSNREFSIRDLSIADLNGDGYMDLFLNGFGPNVLQTYGEFNLGSYVFLNNKGENFIHLKEEENLVFDIEAGAGKSLSHSRFYQTNEESFEVLLTNHDNSFGLVEISHSAFDGIIA